MRIVKRSTLNIAQRYAQRVIVGLLVCAPTLGAPPSEPIKPGEQRLHVVIPASDAYTSLSQFHALLRAHGIVDGNLVFPYVPSRFVSTRAVNCDCTVTEALTRLLAGAYLLFEIDSDHVTISVDERYCWPELGVNAPLPPCWPRPQQEAAWL